MGTQFRLLIILLGMILVVATWTYPQWRPEPKIQEGQVFVFPELTDEQQAAFALLPEANQRLYIQMLQANTTMALEMLTARLEAPVMLDEEERVMPELEGSVIVARGEFMPVEMMMTQNDEREMPPYAELFEASGNVTVYQFPDNRKVLRLENLEVLNGPDLRVLLSMLPNPISGAEILLDRNRIDIGELKTNLGSQTYATVPQEINIDNYASVIIYDRRYEYIFGVAVLN